MEDPQPWNEKTGVGEIRADRERDAGEPAPGSPLPSLDAGIFAQALEQVADAIMITDTEARIIYANPACTELFAVGFDALLGQPPAAFGGESLDAAFYHDMWTILRRGDIWRGSLRIRRPNGTWRDTDATMSPVRDGAQAIVGYLASMRDVTEIRLLERQYTGAQKMEAIGRLAGGIAHDFNNLLTAIMGYTEIGQGQTEDPGVREAFDDIRASATRAAALTWQLLAFSRQQSLKPRVVDLNVVTLSASGLLRQLIGETVRLTLRCQEEVWPVEVDPGQIEQILTNLAVNARDAMPGGGTLTIETANVELGEDYASTHLGSRPGPHVMLAVSDSGTGIDPEILAHVFEPFFTTKEYGKGTGLGLATVYGIVKQSGGFIWVYSEPGHGTTFKVYLPRVDKPVDWVPRSPVEREGRAAGGDETILIVEDDPAVRALTTRILEAAGYTVLQEGDPLEAVKLFDGHGGRVHLLLTDVVLPGMSGRALAECIVAREGLSPRTLYMSGYTREAVVHDGRLDADVEFLEKPFTRDGLLRAVRAVLEQPEER